MNTLIPDLDHFQLEELGQTPHVDNPNAEVSFKVDIEPSRVTRRVVVGILDESKKRGITVAIYPATGEVCDVTNGGGVIGYLSKSPLSPGVPVPCDLTLYRFGKNFVCSVRVHGEIFLYPAFSMDGNAQLTAFVGQEIEGASKGETLSWSRLRLDVLEQPVAA
tara:strand:- start:2820 stop:3308 length:489 start_codon:yes stop_codon:yes gene_type:complete